MTNPGLLWNVVQDTKCIIYCSTYHKSLLQKYSSNMNKGTQN